MLYLCSRCGGIITEKQTIMEDDNGGKLHYFCSWKNWEEHKERLMKGGQDAHRSDSTRRKDKDVGD